MTEAQDFSATGNTTIHGVPPKLIDLDREYNKVLLYIWEKKNSSTFTLPFYSAAVHRSVRGSIQSYNLLD